MQNFEGVKAKFAMELSGYVSAARTFRTRYRDSVNNKHKLYPAARMDFLGITPGTKWPRTLLPVIHTRTAKGGVDKITVCGNIASCMALSGYRVLLIDGDPQVNRHGHRRHA